MSAINAGIHFDGFDRSRGFVANTTESGRRVHEPELVKPQPVEQIHHGARLVYDRDMKRSYVEFLDRESGRVIERFPAENLKDGTMARAIGRATAKTNLLDVLA